MEILQKMFGSAAKVKIMRLFIFNPATPFNLKTVKEKTRLSKTDVRREVALLDRIGMVRKKSSRKNGVTWTLDESFPYLTHIKDLMMDTIISSRDDIAKKISRSCKLKTLVFSGLFINNSDSRADILIVAQSVKKNSLKNTIKKIEAEIGKEIRYVVLNQADFGYRHSIRDRLVRDIFDYPHVVAYDRLGVAEPA